MALYLKYRPKDFASLVGQEFVKTTLQTAVKDNKTVGAYLLCGPRGTGKTSTARIFAKAVNCKTTKDGNPCNMCDTCNAINAENLVDVIEIDAASHTGVDNIREIIEKAQFRPTNAQYKIYIIDEVHMLSKGAFNALLKILEEPPEYVKFILATTETHKVPETIISRCQRYDMKSIGLEDLKFRLSHIASEEKINIDKQSLEYIAQNSGGALRNAISLFEQLIVDNVITYENIIKNLGIVEEDILEDFLRKLLEKNTEIINTFDSLIGDGKNMKLFFKELLFYTKQIATIRVRKGEDIQKHLYVLDILDEAYIKTKNSLDENTTFLIAVLKIVTGYDSSSNIIKKEVKGIEQKKEKVVPERKTTEENKEELSVDDVDDIFGSSAVQEPAPIISSSTEKKEDIFQNDQDFNITEYLNILKKNGAKAMVTMSVKGATASLKGDNLELRFKTKFALNSVNNPDTISLLNGGLISMGLSGVTVKLFG